VEVEESGRALPLPSIRYVPPAIEEYFLRSFLLLVQFLNKSVLSKKSIIIQSVQHIMFNWSHATIEHDGARV
jgi:hypothetical protein